MYSNQHCIILTQYLQNGGKPPKINYSKWEPTDLGDDSGSNNSGWYNLKGVLTHKGRSIDAGHYIGWTKQGDNWVKFDDDKVNCLILVSVRLLWFLGHYCKTGRDS